MKLPLLSFCLGPADWKNTCMRTTSITVMVIFLKLPFWKLLDHSYVHVSFSIFTRDIHNGIWETLYSWRFYGNGSTYVPNFSWLNIMTQTLMEMARKLSFEEKSKPVLRTTFHQIRRWYFPYYCILLFLSSNLVFKVNLVLI